MNRLKPRSNTLLLQLVLGVFLLLNMAVSNAVSQEPPKGQLDNAVYDPARGELRINGWAWSEKSHQAASSIFVVASGKRYEIENLIPEERKDVKSSQALVTSRVGFSGKLDFNENSSTEFESIQVVAYFSSGEVLILPGKITKDLRRSDKKARRHLILLGLVVVLIVLVRFKIFYNWGSAISAGVQKRPYHITACVWVIFFILVAAGITGSSREILFNGPDGVFGGGTAEVRGGKELLFKLRSVRSDEWGVLTPNALAQWNHTPPFPIINTNIGLDGQNMGVIGMTGVPIAQPAALARPATWGYFFLPLRQALSWHWQFPFFACLFVLWQALNLLRPTNSAFNLTLAILFCVAPYAVGWSLWPLYAVFFPLALFVCLASLLRTENKFNTVALGGAMGILLSGWVLVLYPPWQITVGTFCLALGIGWLLDYRHEIQFKSAQWWGLAIAFMAATLLIGSWWMDTYEAVEKIQRTVYPGARNALSGGDMHALWALRGYTNPEALSYGTGKYTNSSEISSYILFPISLFFIGSSQCWRRVPRSWTLRASMLFVVFCLGFWFFGIPILVANWSLWSLVPSARVDPALGLALTVILALVYRPAQTTCPTNTGRSLDWIAFFLALLGASLTFFALRLTPDAFSRTNDLVFASSMALAVFVGSWWMMRDRMLSAVAMLLLLNGVSSIGFNPISQAPSTLKPSAATLLLASDSPSPSRLERTLVIGGGGFGPMALAATGIPTVNGVFYYPQPTLWERIGLPKADWPLVNRYQHLGFLLGKLPSDTTYKVESPRLDVVNVTVDPMTFNFADTGATRVAALKQDAVSLRTSPYLQELGEHGGVFWFAIRVP